MPPPPPHRRSHRNPTIFFINIPVVVLAILAGLILMPESKGPWQKPDLPGAVLSAAGMIALVWWIKAEHELVVGLVGGAGHPGRDERGEPCSDAAPRPSLRS